MQAFPNNFMNNMFDQMKSCDGSSFFKAWTDGFKMFENNNFFTNFQGKMKENEAFSKSFESMNTLFNAGMKNLEAVSEASQKIVETGQDVMKKNAAIYQKAYAELMNLTKDLMSTHNPEIAVSKQTDFMKKSFENLVVDFKDLTESVTDSNSKTFNTMNNKLSANIAKHAEKFKKASAK
jgi:phasin family protein